MYSLAQKRMMAKRDGKNEVVLTMEEAEATLETIRQMDLKLVEYMEYVPEEILQAEREEMFGPKPDDSKRRCVRCKQFPDGPVACCNEWDGSFYWAED